MRSLALLVGLAACGRVGFDGSEVPADTVVEDTVTDTASDPCAPPTTAPPTVTLRGTTFRYLRYDNSMRTFLPAVVITAQDTPGGPSIAQTTSGPEGEYGLELATGGQPLPLVVTYANNVDFTTRVFFDRPITGDLDGPGAQRWQLGDGPVWDNTAMAAVYGDLMIARDNNAATVNIAVRDCADRTIAGASVSFGGTGTLVYQRDDGTPDASMAGTGTMFAHAFVLNAQAGIRTITVTHPAYVFPPQTIVVTEGRFNHLVVARATTERME